MNTDVRIHPDGDNAEPRGRPAIVFRMNDTLSTTNRFSLSRAAKSVPRNEHETQ